MTGAHRGGGTAGRHRRIVDLRSDRLAAALDPVLGDPSVRAVALVDVASGMLLDGDVARDEYEPDLELLGARHAELVRGRRGAGPESHILVGSARGTHHVLRLIPDPHGDGLLLGVVARCSRWRLRRIRQLLAAVPDEVVTAGPSAAGGGGPAVQVGRPPAPVQSEWRPPAPFQPAALPRPGGPPAAAPLHRRSPSPPMAIPVRTSGRDAGLRP